MKQQIKEHETQVKVIERMQEIAVQEQEIQRKEKSLESKVRAPAEAEKYRLEKIAEADKVRCQYHLILIINFIPHSNLRNITFCNASSSSIELEKAK